MTTPGYGGSILHVDMTSGEVRKEALAPELIKKFVGGWGISNKLAYDQVPPDVDTLAPENAIIIGAGPFSGTIIPGASELLITTKFPINGAFATGSGGGRMPHMLKTCGYDNVVITGRAARPVYLKVLDDDVELCDAADIWGKDCVETDDVLRRRHEPCSIVPIGPAGENLVKVSFCQIDKLGSVGSGGLAAVMGSKNLKAIVVCEGTQPVRIASRPKFVRTVDALLERMAGWPGRERLMQGGFTGDILTPGAGPVAGLGNEDYRKATLERHLQVRKGLACASCPMADKERITLCDGEYAGLVGYTSHVMLGGQTAGMTAAEAYDTAVMRDDLANRLGIDLILFGSLVSFATSLYERGIITKEDTGGIELKRDLDTELKLMKLTAHREGFGEVLADGILEAARKIGRGAEQYALPLQVKGRTMVVEARGIGLGTMQLTQVVDPRGSHASAGGGIAYAPGRPPSDFVRHSDRLGVPAEAVERIVGPTSVNIARWLRYAQDLFSLYSCLGMCMRAPIARFYHVNTFAQLYTELTGIETSAAELMKAGERSWNLYKLLNIRAGFGREDDRPPGAWFTPLKGPGGDEYPLVDYHHTRVLTEADFDGIIEDYYDERGWDKKTGIPTPQKLEELGLEA